MSYANHLAVLSQSPELLAYYLAATSTDTDVYLVENEDGDTITTKPGQDIA